MFQRYYSLIVVHQPIENPFIVIVNLHTVSPEPWTSYYGSKWYFYPKFTCCWFSRCVRSRASMHCRVSMNAFRCAFSLGQCVNTPAKFVHNNATIELPICQIPVNHIIIMMWTLSQQQKNQEKRKMRNLILCSKEQKILLAFWWRESDQSTSIECFYTRIWFETIVESFGNKLVLCIVHWKLPPASQQQLNAYNSDKNERLIRVAHRRVLHANEPVTLYKSYKQISTYIHWPMWCFYVCRERKLNWIEKKWIKNCFILICQKFALKFDILFKARAR